MDPQLKQYLEGMETRIVVGLGAVETRIGAVETRIGAVETRIGAVETQIGALQENMGTLEARIMDRVDGRIDAVEERLKDFVRRAVVDLETKLIAEFWKWGRTSEMRTKQVLADVRSLDERLVAVEDRITALERGK